MIKRLISATASQIANMSKVQLLESIQASEGRVIVTECIPAMPNLPYEATQMEMVSAFGSDIVLINMFDVDKPVVYGINAEKSNIIKEIKRLTGRPVGINLEPVDSNGEIIGEMNIISRGRQATADNGKKAVEMGVDFIVLTGNPGVGVSNKAIIESLKQIKKSVKDDIVLIAGKMHASGSRIEAGSSIISKEDILNFVNAGANVILLPAPGTVPGVTLEFIKELVEYAHSLGVLTITSIGTSQEGADVDTIRQIALMCKMTGTDMHHLGDGGSSPGMTNPENIMAYSIVIRGKRHTYNRMALSIQR